MANIRNNLYPPIVSTFMPAFIYDQKCRIYFSISIYNTLDNINSSSDTVINPDVVQVSVRRQNNNQSVLDSTKYPSEIMIKSLGVDEDRQSNDKYYIDIENSDIQNGFNLNEYYKVQIRFTNINASAPPARGGLDFWIFSNLEYFSEWSTVVLIYSISQPIIQLKNFVEGSLITFDSFDISVVGNVSFDDQNDKETMSGYQIFLYNDSGQLLQDSGMIYTNDYNNPNDINYTFLYGLFPSINYTLKINIITSNFYTLDNPKVYQFKISEETQPELQLNIKIIPDEQQGALKVYMQNNFLADEETNKRLDEADEWKYNYENVQDRVNGKSLYLTITYNSQLFANSGDFNSAVYLDNDDKLVLYNKENMWHDLSKGTRFIIKRSSSKQNNFNNWRQVADFTIEENNVTKLIWLDYTVQPGVWYKYYIIRYNSLGQRTSSLKTQPGMVLSQNIFLVSNGQQLKIKFDPQISNFSIKTSEALVETIGSKYPFIRKNGNINYKTFTLSGTITHFMDVKANLFNSSKQDLYGEYYNLYEQYNINHNINPMYDFVYEKQFRNKVMNFLYDNNIKLFRSLTEGNMLVKLMNISFTPNVSLGRMIYSFSCTVYEIEEDNYANYEKYNLLRSSNKYNVRQLSNE